jgi:CRISPR-associated protein Cas2
MELLVAYDVATETADGRRRLRRVAKICQSYGQRVQKSVFECVLNPMQFEQFRCQLAAEIDTESDSMRIYRLREPHEQYLEILGRPHQFDIRDPIVL